jgi:hypothetical protein
MFSSYPGQVNASRAEIPQVLISGNLRVRRQFHQRHRSLWLARGGGQPRKLKMALRLVPIPVRLRLS